MSIRVGGQGFERLPSVKIFDQTLTATDNFDVTDIPASFVSLQAVLLARSDVASGTEDPVNVFLNGDTTAANYRAATHLAGASHTSVQGDGAGLFAIATANSPANYFGVTRLFFDFYTMAFNKMVLSLTSNRLDATNIRIDTRIMQWENTATINQITIQPDGYATDEFVIGSRLIIYGIY